MQENLKFDWSVNHSDGLLMKVQFIKRPAFFCVVEKFFAFTFMIIASFSKIVNPPPGSLMVQGDFYICMLQILLFNISNISNLIMLDLLFNIINKYNISNLFMLDLLNNFSNISNMILLYMLFNIYIILTIEQ